MASDFKVLVRPTSAQTAAELARSGLRVKAYRGWLEVLGAEWKSDALEFSKRCATTSVWWSLQANQVWLCCFHEGAALRELRFSAEISGWSVNRGDGMPFEDIPALALWLRKWRIAKAPLTARDGATLLDAFIGTKKPKKPTRNKKPTKKRAAR